MVLAASGVAAVGAALVIHAYESSNTALAVAGVACVLAIAPARAAAMLTTSTIAAAMRTDDMAEMGDAWRRMRTTTVALLVSALVIAFGAAGGLAFAVTSRSQFGLAIGEAGLVGSIPPHPGFFWGAVGSLRPRRAFWPCRVR